MVSFKTILVSNIFTHIRYSDSTICSKIAGNQILLECKCYILPFVGNPWAHSFPYSVKK